MTEDVSRKCPVPGCGKAFANYAGLRMHNIRVHLKKGSGHGTFAAGGDGAKKFGAGKRAEWKKTFPPPTAEVPLTVKGKPRQLNKDGSVRLGWGEKLRAQGITPKSPAHKNGKRPVVAEEPKTTLADAIAALEVKRDSISEIIADLKRMG